MEYLIIGFTALLASALTLFSGFGLGTILLPAFILFFPVDTAIAMTAIVHLLNNIFKFYLIGRFVSKEVVLKFGLVAFLAAFLGAWLLLQFSDMTALYTYTISGKNFAVYPVNLLIGLLIILFAVLDFLPAFTKMALPPKWLPLGGFLSGFFGGLSGHQGAFRTAFLLKCGLSKESFIATGITIAMIIDVSRLFMYSSKFNLELSTSNASILITAIVAAFAGAFIGTRLMKKITMKSVHLLVGVLLSLIGIGLISGLI